MTTIKNDIEMQYDIKIEAAKMPKLSSSKTD